MSDKIKVLIVDDDEHIAELISLYLIREGYETKEVYDGNMAMSAFEEFKPGLILLDIMLPGIDGYEVCREVRKTSKVPIIMLTAKGDTFDKVLGLELGADDYIVKPFEPKELIARVKAVLRRYDNNKEEKEESGSRIVFQNLEINMDNYTVTYHGKELNFPPKEFELLCFLAQKPNQVFTRDQLLDKIWGYEYIGDTRTVDVHIKRIREKFDNDENWSVKTVWGVGYKFEVKQK
ncbi:MAG: response regulator transcription factor [Firmicutes bacterium]|jgi:DNA-binding response OmpR family regulator|nr:response regulator transcription factor [Bacillota bacterium]